MSHLVAQEKKRQHSIWLARNALFSCESIDAINTTCEYASPDKANTGRSHCKAAGVQKVLYGQLHQRACAVKNDPNGKQSLCYAVKANWPRHVPAKKKPGERRAV